MLNYACGFNQSETGNILNIYIINFDIITWSIQHFEYLFQNKANVAHWFTITINLWRYLINLLKNLMS